MQTRSRGARAAGPAAAALLGALVLAAPAAAQDRKHLTQIGIATGTVAPGGLGFVQLSGTNDSPAGRTDGSLALGMGFGSAEDGLGVQVTAQVTSLTDSFGDSGYLGLKLSRRLGAAPVYVALQGDHLVNWGDAGLIDPSAKLALTWFTAFRSGGQSYPVMLTVGAGTAVRNLRRDPGLFAGIGVGLTDTFALSAAWSGDTVDLGGGIRLGENLSLTASVDDAFDMEDRRRLTVSVTYTFRSFGG